MEVIWSNVPAQAGSCRAHCPALHVQLALLKTSGNGDSTSSLGNPCHCSITLTANKSCLMLRRNLPLVFQFLHTGPVPGNGRAPLSAHSPLTYLYRYLQLYEICPEPSLLQAPQCELFPPFLRWQMLPSLRRLSRALSWTLCTSSFSIFYRRL